MPHARDVRAAGVHVPLTSRELDSAELSALKSGAGGTFGDGVRAMRTALELLDARHYCWSTGDTECVSPLVCHIYGCKLKAP